MKHLIAPVLAAAGICFAATVGMGQPVPGFAQHYGWAVPYGRAEQVSGRQIFNNHGISCHALKRGERAFGPSLLGVVNRPAGSLSGFAYSDALKKSGLVWTEDNLQKWIANNAALVPNTLMPHVSISDPAEQIYLVAFLKTLKAPTGH